MIQKVMPKINTIRPNRIHLKSSNSHLKNLAGSSMSGWNTPKFEPVEKVIPGGLDFKEKACNKFGRVGKAKRFPLF